MLESVPWMVGGGAQHSAEIGRLLGYAAFRANEGIVALTDFKVTALATPGATVQVAPGACAITNRALNQAYQSYVARNLATDTVSISPGGASARSDMVVIQIEDPYLAGEPWQAPAAGSEPLGPYVFFRVISNVPATARKVSDVPGLSARTALALARIDVPANATTITGSMIVDLRVVANPRSETQLYTFNPSVVTNVTSATMVDWVGSWQVNIPAWASQVAISARVDGAGVDRSSSSVNGTAIGQVRAILGATLVTQPTGYDIDVPAAAKASRFAVGLGDTLAIAEALRGTTQTLKFQGLRSSGNKNLYADASSSCQVTLRFVEIPS